MSLDLFFLHASGAATIVLILAAVLARTPENASLAALLAVLAAGAYAALLGGGSIASVSIVAIHAPLILAALLGTRTFGAKSRATRTRAIAAVVVASAFALIGFQATRAEPIASERSEASTGAALSVDVPSRVPLAALAIAAWCVFAASVAVRRRSDEEDSPAGVNDANEDEGVAPWIVERGDRWIAPREEDARLLGADGREVEAP